MKTLILLLVFCIAGCAAPRPYAEVGVGYSFSTNIEDQVNDTAHFEVGIDWKRIACALRHSSHFSRGWPVDKGKDAFVDELLCLVRWGGR